MATATDRGIDFKNIGAVERATAPYPEDGGVVVWRGPNGSGKTTLLSATDSLINKSGSPPVRDGQLHASVEGLGVKLTIGRSTRRSGEAEVHGFESKHKPEDLVDPGIKDAEAADAARIKALVKLVGAKADAALFHELLGDRAKFESVISPKAIASDDLITMASRIKADIEKAARDAEDRGENARGSALADRKAAGGLDMGVECNSAVLSGILENAIRVEADLKARDKAAVESLEAAERANDRLQDSKADYRGPTVAEAKSAFDTADDTRNRRAKAVADLMEQLRGAQAELKESDTRLEAAKDALKAATDHENTVANFQSVVTAAANVRRIEAEEIAAAGDAVRSAREAIETGALVRKAKEQLASAERSEADASDHDKRAAELRQAARGTDEILSRVVAKAAGKLRVEAARLVLDTSRGVTYFGELSDGERWKMALDIAIDAVGKGGILTASQAAWEGLDGNNRKAIRDHLSGSGVVLYTAEADDGELRAEVFNE